MSARIIMTVGTTNQRTFCSSVTAFPYILNHTATRLAPERIQFESVRTFLLAQWALASDKRLVCILVLVGIVVRIRIVRHSNNFASSKRVLVVIFVSVELERRDVVIIRNLVQAFFWFHRPICDVKILFVLILIILIIIGIISVFIASIAICFIIRRVSWFVTIWSTNDWFR
jgi:hypothetical protein